jgi:hypothetical protein
MNLSRLSSNLLRLSSVSKSRGCLLLFSKMLFTWEFLEPYSPLFRMPPLLNKSPYDVHSEYRRGKLRFCSFKP